MTCDYREQLTLAPLKTRLVSVDLWRGVALLYILINHLPGNPLQSFTSRAFGFSDAAAWYFFLSGVVSQLAFHKRLQQAGPVALSKIVGLRLAQLYLAQLIISAFFIAAVLLTNALNLKPAPWWMAYDSAPIIVASPPTAIHLAITLQLNAYCTDILVSYMVILPLFAVTLYLESKYRIPQILPAIALYLITSASATPCFQHWTFNPLAWFLLFSIGAYIQRNRGKCYTPGWRGRLVLALAFTTVALCALVKQSFRLPAPWSDWLQLLQPNGEKSLLHWGYLSHALLVIYVIDRLMIEEHVQSWRTTRGLAALGQKPLAMFVLTTVACYTAYCFYGNRLDALQTAVSLGFALGLCLFYQRRSLRSTPSCS